MTRNNDGQDLRKFPEIVMGSKETIARLRSCGIDPGKIKVTSWSKCKWSYDELTRKMSSVDCFCLALRKAGEKDAWVIAESFHDLKNELEVIFREACLREKPALCNEKNKATFFCMLDAIRSKTGSFYNTNGYTPSQNLRQRITDTYSKSQRGSVTWNDLTAWQYKKKSLRGDISLLFVKGDTDIEKKRRKEESQRALKQKFLSSISGNADIELLNYASNRVNEKISKDTSLKDSLDLSFISIGTHWETRDCEQDIDNKRVERYEHQLAMMKVIIYAIVNRQNVEIEYHPYGYKPITCTVSPHRIRKDRQWIIYGNSNADDAYIADKEQDKIYSFKLDRIAKVSLADGNYRGDDDPEIKKVYQRISRHQITYDVISEHTHLQTVVIAVRGKDNGDASHGRIFAYHKIKEEMLHRTQVEVSRDEVIAMGHKDAVNNLEGWGFFKFEVSDYDRIAYSLLKHYANLKVIAPLSLHDRMRKISEELYLLYHNEIIE